MSDQTSLQGGNVDTVLKDVMGHGNALAGAILPGLLPSKIQSKSGRKTLGNASGIDFRKETALVRDLGFGA